MQENIREVPVFFNAPKGILKVPKICVDCPVFTGARPESEHDNRPAALDMETLENGKKPAQCSGPTAIALAKIYFNTDYTSKAHTLAVANCIAQRWAHE